MMYLAIWNYNIIMGCFYGAVIMHLYGAVTCMHDVHLLIIMYLIHMMHL